MYDSDTILLTDNQMLIKVAKKNYHIFATPTNLVDSIKLKRYYTPEQLCDLDVKTSVNKIGEIVNLSQVLNSMYWDKLHHGATHEELHELYCDVATLDVMSNLAIDAAKKEFAIDITQELNLIRNKYADRLVTEDNKKILPNFFAHISRQKGYYDPQHKAYLQHDTSMDYLQSVVRRFKTKNKIPKPTSRLIDLFNMKPYRSSDVNHKQISHIMKYVKWYSVEMNKLFSDHYYESAEHLLEEETRYDKCSALKDQLINYVNQYRIGYSTMVFIIKQLEKREYYKYRNILLPLLFTLCRTSFLDAVNKSVQEIDVLEEDGIDIKLFDFCYNIKKNQPFFAKNCDNSVEDN